MTNAAQLIAEHDQEQAALRNAIARDPRQVLELADLLENLNGYTPNDMRCIDDRKLEIVRGLATERLMELLLSVAQVRGY